jgi:hypothetical protein
MHVKGKVPLWGRSALQPYRLIVLWPPKEFLHSSLEALHTKRQGWPQLAKEGTIDRLELTISNSLKLLGSFTCRKAGTWDRYFYFPAEGRHAEDFYTHKNPTASAGFEPPKSGTRGQHANH